MPPHATAARHAHRRESAARTHPPPRNRLPPPTAASAAGPAARPFSRQAPTRSRTTRRGARIRRDARIDRRETASRPQRPHPPQELPHVPSPAKRPPAAARPAATPASAARPRHLAHARGISRTPAPASPAAMHARAKNSHAVLLPSRQARTQHSPAEQSPAANPARESHGMPPPLSNRNQHLHAHPRFAPTSKPSASRPRASRKTPPSSIHRQFAALSTFVPLLNPRPALFVAPPRPKGGTKEKELAPPPDTNDICYCSSVQGSTKV
jgi:hypothetical protein